MDILENLSVSLLAGGMAAFLTHMLTFNRFQKEKRWNRKSVAYEQVIGALHELNRHYLTELERLEVRSAPRVLSDEAQRKLTEAQREITRVIDFGAFLLPDDARTCLQQFESAAKNAEYAAGDVYEYVDQCYSATQKCLKSIVDIAARDGR